MGRVTYKIIDINLIKYNENYKISKNVIDDKLKESIKKYGVICPVVLIKVNSHYEIVSGHNRIVIAKRFGISKIDCLVLNRFDINYYVKLLIIRIYEGRIGPIGKIKAFQIIKDNYSNNDILEILKVPEILVNDNSFSNSILDLPLELKNYLDLKNINYKIIKKILKVPGEVVNLIAKWTGELAIRNNIFKEIINNVYDIYKKDKSTSEIFKINLPESDDIQKEKYLYNEINKIRYPLYYTTKIKTSNLINNFKNNNIKIEYPKYFEENYLDISFRVYKNRTDIDKIVKNIDKDKIEELLGFL